MTNFYHAIGLACMPDPVCYEIFNKMGNYEIIYMRRTCSFANSLIDRYQKKLSGRPALGQTIFIQQFFDEENGCVKLHFSPKYDQNTTVIDEDFERRIAGISFSLIRIEIDLEDRHNFLELLEIFKRVRPVCECLELRYCPVDLIVPLTDCVTFKKMESIIRFTNRNVKVDLNGALLSLKKAKNSSKFEFNFAKQQKITDGILEKVRDFSEVGLVTNVKGLHQFLRDLHNSTGKIELKWLTLFFETDDPLFDCESLSFIKTLRIPGSDEWARFIFLTSQFVFITVYLGHWHPTLYFQFAELSAPVLEKSLKYLHFPQEIVDQFVSEVQNV